MVAVERSEYIKVAVGSRKKGNVYIFVYLNVYLSVNMSVTLSVRIDTKVKEEIEALGYAPSTFLKKVLLRELKKEQARRALSWLKENRLDPGEGAVEEAIREDRDSR